MYNAENRFNYYTKILRDLIEIYKEKPFSLNGGENINIKQEKKKITPLDSLNFLFNDFYKGDFNNINKESALWYFLNGKHKETYFNKDLIYPFGVNKSQKSAIENAFKSNISVIQGPPGTGKTQTILNIISNIIIENKTVAIVSNNEAAVDNVWDKLNRKTNDEELKDRLDNIWFIASPIGKSERKKEYFSEETQNNYKNWRKEWKEIFEKVYENEDLEVNKIKTDISNKLIELEELQLKKQILNNLKHHLPQIKKEKELFELNVNLDFKNDNKLLKIKLKDLKELNVKLKKYNKEKINWFFKLKLKLKYKLPKKFFKSDILIEIYYHILSRIESDCINKIINCKKSIVRLDSGQLDYVVQKSKDVLFNHIYKNNMKKIDLEMDPTNFRKDGDKLKELFTQRPIVLSTTFSIMNTKKMNYLYDYLIIDEASQSNMLASMGAIACAKNIIIVGDLKQLSQVENNELDDYFNKIKFIEENYQHNRNNILKATTNIYGSKIPTQLLREHYRCHPGIIQFCNEKYYENQLIIMTENEEKSPFEIIIGDSLHYCDDNSSSSKTSYKELKNIENYLKDKKFDNLGLISPYKKQGELFNNNFKDKNITGATVHKFQGQEKDVIIFGLTNYSQKGKNTFITSELINVAVSRAKNKFVLACPGNIELGKESDIKDLYNYILFNYPESIKHINKNSEFYILSNEFNKDMLEMIEKYNKNNENNKNKSSEPSEIIIHNLLNEIIREESFRNLEITLFKKLSLLVPNSIKKEVFNKREKEFLKHHWSHVDFLLYDKFSKKPVLAIEVDGVTFHGKPKQKWRDEIKNKALETEGIPLLRIETNTNVKIGEKIKKKLEEILQ